MRAAAVLPTLLLAVTLTGTAYAHSQQDGGFFSGYGYYDSRGFFTGKADVGTSYDRLWSYGFADFSESGLDILELEIGVFVWEGLSPVVEIRHWPGAAGEEWGVAIGLAYRVGWQW